MALINLRNAMMTGGKKLPYVSDSLMAMFDGEWNAGIGVHDASAAYPKDLAGNLAFDANASSGTVEFFDNHFTVSGGALYYFASDWDSRLHYTTAGAPIGTIEFVAKYVVNMGSFFSVSTNDTSGNRRGRFNMNVQDSYLQANVYGLGGVNRYTSKYFNTNSVRYGAVTSDGSTVILYLDGEAGTSTKVGYASNYRGNYCQIGGVVANSGTLRGDYYTLRCHSRVLTAEEIAKHHAIEQTRFGVR